MSYTTPRPQKSRPINVCWPILDLDEIITILSGFDLNLCEDQLLRPTQQVAESIYTRLVSSLLGTDIEQVSDAYSQCAGGSENESTLQDGFVFFAIQKAVFTLFQDCGVHDFSMDDMLHPTSKRLKLLLSAFINYARFRECREEWALYMRQAMEDERDKLEVQAQERSIKMERLKQLRRLVGENSLEKELANNEVKKAQLNKLADMNIELIEEKDQLKPRLKALVSRLDQQQKMMNNLNQDIFTLKSTIAVDPVALKRDADSLHQLVAQRKVVSNTLEQRNRKLDISIQSLKHFKLDVDTLKSASQNLHTEKQNLVEIHDRFLRLSHLVELSSLDIDNGNMDIRRSQHECDQLEQKIQIAKHQTGKLNEAAEARMAYLRKQLGVEYGEKALILQNIGILNEDVAAIGVASSSLREAYMVEYKCAAAEAERAQSNMAKYIAKLKNGVL